MCAVHPGDKMERKQRELGGGCKLCYGGANKHGKNGVGIVLSKDLKDSDKCRKNK